MKYIRFIESRPEAMREMLAEKPVAYVPFGALEWHGEHNPLGLDGLKAEAICELAVERTGGVLFPCVFWGAFDTMPFPFTFHFKRYGTRGMIRQMLKELEEWGFRMIVLLTGHYPSSQVKLLERECRRFNKSGPAYALGVPEQALGVDRNYFGEHAAMWETSMMMSIRPEMVDISLMPEGLSAMERCVRFGVMGKDPRALASGEKGREMMEHIVDGIANVVMRVLDEKGPLAIEGVYERFHKALRPSLKLAREALDMHSFSELIRYGWWYWRNF
jgi:creatinine amidohydrolase